MTPMGRKIAALPPEERAAARFELLSPPSKDVGRAKDKPEPKYEQRPCNCRPHGRPVNHGPHYRKVA